MDVGEWGDPWAPSNDDAYRALLAHVRSGPPGPVDVEARALGSGTRSRSRAAALRLEDLGILTRRPDGGWQYAPLSDADLSDAWDSWAALFGTALRATVPVLTDEHRKAFDDRAARARSLAALRLPEYPTAFSAAAQFWFEHCPNRLVGDLGVRAYERLRWGRSPTPPWSVHDVDGWLATLVRAADTRDPDLATEVAEGFAGLLEQHRRTIGVERPDPGARIVVAHDDRLPGPVDRALLRDVRNGSLPAGTTHSLTSLTARTGAPRDVLVDALRRLYDLGLVRGDRDGVLVTGGSLGAWQDAMGLLSGVFGSSAVRVLPGLEGSARDAFHRLVERVRSDGEVRDHRYTESAFAITRFLAEHSGNRWERQALRLAMGRLAYSLPEAPAFRQWDADALWSSLDVAAGAGDVAAARTAAELFVEVARAHVDDVAARYGTMGP